MHLKLFSLKSLLIILGAVLIGILYFGLGPQSIWFPNGVDWISDQPGIRFSEYGIAYTNPYVETTLGDNSAADGFSVEIALKPAIFDGKGFTFVWVLHGGNDRNQLVMGQWRSWFIIMNGDDYDHSRKLERISADAASPPREKQFVTITSGPGGSRIYFDGRLVRTKKDLALKIPSGKNVRLIVGNSVSNKHSWRGDVYGLALYRYPLTESEVAHHFDSWSKDHNFTFAEADTPFLLYVFDEKSGPRAADHAGGNRHLYIPPRAKVLERQFLERPRVGMGFGRLNIKDIVVNLLGFIPLGFILAAILDKLGGIFSKRAVFLTVAACFFVSLLIETVQTSIPSRNSDLLDLVFNTSGGLIGAVIYLMTRRRIATSSGP
jgi:hypothetical protein